MTTIVIVDDQLTSRQVLVQLVSSMDGEFNVQSFANPVEGLNWCVRNPVDLILTDYKMPEMNGVEFIQKIRSYDACEHIPIIKELQLRKVLQPAPLRPRYMSDPRALKRLDYVRQGLTVVDLLRPRP